MRQILVHPKDKISDGKKCGAVYCVPCLSCPKKYIGETGRKLETRIEDHKKETEQVQARRKTRSVTSQEDNTKRKSAVCEHAREMNHVMNWDDVKILERESDKYTRWIKESVQVRMLHKDIPMNRDEGNYKLPHVWDTLLAKPPSKPPGRSSLRSWQLPIRVGWGEAAGGDKPNTIRLEQKKASTPSQTNTARMLQVQYTIISSEEVDQKRLRNVSIGKYNIYYSEWKKETFYDLIYKFLRNETLQ